MVIVLIIAGIAVVSLVVGGARDQDLSVARVNAVQAFFASEAGMSMAVREMIENTDFDEDGSVGSIASTAETTASLHGALVDVTVTPSGSNLVLTSLGERLYSRQACRLIFQSIVAPSGGGVLYGAAVNGDIEIDGNGHMDAFNPAYGVYNPSTEYVGTTSLATNATGSDSIDLNAGATIVGDIFVGEGGDPSTVIDTTGNAEVTGAQSTVDEPVEMPSIATPSGLPASSGNMSFPGSGTTTYVTGMYHYNHFTITNTYLIVISGDVVIYCDGKFSMKNSSSVLLAAGSTLVVYAEQFDLGGTGTINIPTPPEGAEPSRVTMYQTGSHDFIIDNQGGCAAIVIAPNAEVSISNSGALFGLVRAESLYIGGRFTQDLSYSGGTGEVIDEPGMILMVSDWDSIPPQ